MTSKFCSACSMPLENSPGVGVIIDNNYFCIHCINKDKTVKTCAEIFEGGIQFFLQAITDLDRDFAERIVRKNMKRLEFWRTRRDVCLEGPEATDEEFAAIFKKLA